MNTTNLLQNLRDIHLPSPISLWPQTIGWYILLIILTITVILLTRYTYFIWIKRQRTQHALKKLEMIMSDNAYDQNTRFAQLSSFIRRIALAKYQREDVAGLQGEAWLKFLDQSGNTTTFTQAEGRCLITAPYKKIDKFDIHALKIVLEQWIKTVLV